MSGNVLRSCRWAACLALVLGSGSLRAEPYSEAKEPAKGLRVELQVDRTTLALSDSLRVTLTVEGIAPVEVEAIKDITPSADWTEQALGKPETTLLDGGRMRWRQSFRLDPLKPEKHSLPISPLRFRQGPKLDPDGNDWLDHAWKPIPVEVTTSVAAPVLTEIRDITPIETLPEPPSRKPWYIAGAVILASVSVLGFGVWIARRRPPRPGPELLPHEWALRELERIDGLDLPGLGAVERYHTLISDVLRHYLERRYGLRAPEQTTPEFLDNLRRSATLPPVQQEQLREFLGRCDLAKFARVDYSTQDCHAAADMARAFITTTNHTNHTNQKDK